MVEEREGRKKRERREVVGKGDNLRQIEIDKERERERGDNLRQIEIDR